MRSEVVTVFGGAGFIGRHLVRRLAERGAVIRVATRRPELTGDLRPMGDVGQIVTLRCDVGDPQQVEALVAGASSVVNLIGILHERRRGDFDRLQGELPGTIGRACAAHGVRSLVQVSAIGADPGSPSRYARSKAAGEAAARAAFPATVVLRPSVVFGPGDGFFCRFAAMARLAPALPLVGGGKTRFQFVYVGDVAAAIVAGLERPELAGRTFELGGPRAYSFEEALRYLLRLVGRRRLLLHLPVAVARVQARFFELLPNPPLTRDQLLLLERDNVVAPDAAGLRELGIEPTPLEVILPNYIGAYARERVTMPVA